MPAVPRWDFKEPQPGDTIRDPIQGEFFSTEAIRDDAEALVREAIQNSLDARQAEGPARVRIYLSEADCVPASTISRYLNQGEAHIAAKDNGLGNAPKPADGCCFAVIEDFNTTGLTGDPAQWQALERVRNSFFTFFRAEGRSDKQESEGGRWGVGKFVFARSSRISAFFGLTVRADSKKPMLMGRCILKSHWIGSKFYVPDGYFGVRDSRGLVLPIEDRDYIDSFVRDFRLSRRNEPGLSVVVPWVDPDLDADSILKAVIRDYFYPILDGTLIVTVETPRRNISIDANKIERVVAGLPGGLQDEVLPLLKLAKWARDFPADESFGLTSQREDEVPAWGAQLVPAEARKKIAARLDAGDMVAVHVPTWVKVTGGRFDRSAFDVYLVREGLYDAGKPCFVRDGVIISDVRGSGRTQGIRSLVVVRRGSLATLLGDSENPAHTQWQKDSSHFHNRSVRDKKTIDFVVKSVVAIMRLITDSDTQEDETSLLDFFYLPPSEEEQRIRRKDTKRPPPPPPPPPSPQPFRVTKVEGGFTVTSADGGAQPAPVLDVVVAYQTRRGNPFVQYDRADFVVERLRLEQRGLEIIFRKNNRVQASIREPAFSLTLTGFDARRDLRIRVQAKEQADAADT
jgi:hypothetical protein